MPDQEPNEVDVTADVADLPAADDNTPDDTAAGENTATDDAGKDADTADDVLDLETLMLEEADETKGYEPDADATPGETKKEEDILSETGKLSALTAELKSLKDELAKLPGDQLSEKQNKSFTAMRTANEKILGRVEALSQDLAQVTRFGEPERIREAVELQDKLYQYDVKEGYQSPKPFAEHLAKKDPQHAFRTAAYLLAQPSEGGNPMVEGFVKSILQLDPNRLEEFQAISRGEIPAGYEGLNLTLDEDLQKVPTERHAAFKRLTGSQQAIVRGGFETYATEAEKLDAKRVLEDSQRLVNSETQQAREIADTETTFNTAVDTYRDKSQVDALTSVHTGIGTALSKITFSTDKVVDASIRYGVNRAIFDFENPVFRVNAEKHLIEMGLPEAEIKQVGKEVSRLLDELDSTIEHKSFAMARMEKARKLGDKEAEKVQKQEAQRADEAFQSKIKRLKVLGIGLAAKVSKKAGAKLAQMPAAKVPEHVEPVIKTETSSNGSWQRPPASAYAKAAAEGKVLGR